MWRDEATLFDIREACHAIQEFIAGMDRDAFLADAKTRSAVIHQLLILGEATKRLSREFRCENADLPWTAMAGMRDVLIHGYDRVDFNEVWKTATEDVPDVLAKLDALAES